MSEGLFDEVPAGIADAHWDAWLIGGDEAVRYMQMLAESGFSDLEAAGLATIAFGYETEETRFGFIERLVSRNQGDGTTL